MPKTGNIPSDMVQRWSRQPSSCQFCRAKKLRCDRTHPCSNCTLRDHDCVYAGRRHPKENRAGPPRPGRVPSPPQEIDQPTSGLDEPPNDLAARVQRLEEAVFHSQPITGSKWDLENGNARKDHDTNPTPFSSQFMWQSSSHERSPPHTLDASHADPCNHLPPKQHALRLMEHFCTKVQLSFQFHHMPSTRLVLDRAYRAVYMGEKPSPADLVLLFTVFTGAAMFATPELLKSLQATSSEFKSAFELYNRLALSLVDDVCRPGQECLTGLQGLASLMHLHTDLYGMSEQVHLLRTRIVIMARKMQIHRLDTPRSQQERRGLGDDNGLNVEIQRRIWWYIVSTDWLLAISGGFQEGIYIFHPTHMKVNYPSNVENDSTDLPMSVPTCMSAFICRLRLAEVCREVVDTIPSMWLDPQDLDYNMVLSLDAKFQTYLDSLPYYFQLDTANVQKSQDIYRDRPYIQSQALMLHLGSYARICRLHRPFHLEFANNPQYAYSRLKCVRAAQTMLELQQLIEGSGITIGSLHDSKCWAITQAVFLAALTLATDVSLDPCTAQSSSGSNTRKSEVLSACKVLEKMAQESVAVSDGVQRGVRMLMSMINKKRPAAQPLQNEFIPVDLPLHQQQQQQTPITSTTGHNHHQTYTAGNTAVSGPVLENSALTLGPFSTGTDPLPSMDEQDWDHLWSEFYETTPGWDLPQWNSLLEGMDMTFGPAI